MLTIKPDGIPDSSPTPPAPEAPAATPEEQVPASAAAAAEPKKPIPMAWIPATLGVGLLIAVVYLGGRIVTAKAHTSAPAPRAAAVQKVPAPVPTPAPVAPQTPAPVQTLAENKPSPLAKPAPLPAPVAVPPPTPTPIPVPEVKQTVPARAKALIEAKPAADTASEDIAGLPTITPKPGERYVQIGALIPKAAHRYLGELHLDQLKPQIAPGPSPDLVRVLVGPFDDRDVLAAVQAQLDAQGIENFIRRY